MASSSTVSCRRRRGPTRPPSGAAAAANRRGQTRPRSNKAAIGRGGQEAPRPTARLVYRPWPNIARSRTARPPRPTAAAKRRTPRANKAAVKKGRTAAVIQYRPVKNRPNAQSNKTRGQAPPRPNIAALKHRPSAAVKQNAVVRSNAAAQPVKQRGPTGQTARPNWSNSAAQLVKQRGPTKRGGQTNAVVGSNWSNSAAANRPVKRPRTAPASTTPAARTAGRPGRPRCNQNAVVKQPRMWSNTTLTPVINRRPPAAGY